MKKYIYILCVILLSGTLLADLPLLNQKVDSLMLVETPLGEVARLISSSSKVPVVCTPDAAKTEVSLFFTDLSLESAMQAMCRAHGLWMNVSPEGVIILTTIGEHLASESTYSADFMETITVKYPSVNDVCDTLKGLFRDRIVFSQLDDDDLDPLEDINRALNRMDVLSERSQFDISNQGSSSSYSYSHKSSSASKIDDLKQLESLQENEDFQRAQMGRQLLSDDPNSLKKGLSLIYLSSLPETNTLMVRSSDRNAVQQVKKAVEEMDRPRGQVLLRVSVLSVQLDDSLETGVEWLFEDGSLSGGLADSLINSLSDSSSDYTISQPVVSYVSDELQARVKLLATKENTRELANPTLLVADNEAANVFIGTDGKYIDSIEAGTTTSTDGVVTTSETTVTLEDRNIGLSLLIAPRIHADRSVTLRILQERSEIEADPREIEAAKDYTIQVQDVNQELVTSTLVVDDNSLVILGGMIYESQLDSDSGVPILKDIPFLGRLFSSKKNEKVRQELIVLIRPHVISIPGESAEISQQTLKELGVNPDLSPKFSEMSQQLFEEKDEAKKNKDAPVPEEGEE